MTTNREMHDTQFSHEQEAEISKMMITDYVEGEHLLTCVLFYALIP
jgi:hypothetical protein